MAADVVAVAVVVVVATAVAAVDSEAVTECAAAALKGMGAGLLRRLLPESLFHSPRDPSSRSLLTSVRTFFLPETQTSDSGDEDRSSKCSAHCIKIEIKLVLGMFNFQHVSRFLVKH